MRIFLILLCFCLLGCSKNPSETPVIKLQASGEILRIPIDSLTANISTGLVRYEDYLVNVNWNTNSLQFYDLNSEKLSKEIFYQYEGPQGVGSIFGIHIHSLDSIFLFTQMVPVITLTDTTGIIKNRIQYTKPEGHTNAFVHNAYFRSTPFLQNGKMLVKTHAEGNYRQMTEERLNKSFLAYRINLEDGSHQSSELTYPEGYLNSGLKFFEPSLVFHPEYTVYSLFGDHRLYKQLRYGGLETFDGKSQYLDESLPYFPIDGERFETQKYLTASSRYEALVYDEFREVYYRFAYPTLAIEKEEDLFALRENPGPFVIQVFDEDLKLITETYFEGGMYFPNNSFITEKGLYLSANNPENPEAEEDAFRFELIQLIN
ncbi:DUF4221 domain-containing protein [Algoriphagus sp. NBT04N3]|jgi:hypothetical protein|uniref:DUF4221 family protein n=1 Tax=Algoriphagus sp. NBT04N3 TaxID=2705473 RepID=UPI001C634C07|nr:DUF4221 family protein [Algoriphagus sp. NBT04N3]QYH39940.1 DUF4221 domain-containing protein [Algoriphagus sp. NBT04N3]